MSPAMRSSPPSSPPSPPSSPAPSFPGLTRLRRPFSLRTVAWLLGALLALVGTLLLAEAETRYIEFISSVDDIDVELRWVGVEADEASPSGEDRRERLTLRFAVEFANDSAYTLWVEAINTQLYLDGQYAGAYTITEGRYEVPPGERRTVPLTVVLWGERVALYRSAETSQGWMQVVGRARARLAVGGTERKVFYPVRGSFSVAAGPTEAEARNPRREG